MCELLKESLPSQIALRTELPLDTWPIHVDRAELELALLNLVVNARDAMPHRGIITISARNIGGEEQHSEAWLPGKDFVAISVSDTGGGIPPEILHRIFDPFFTTKEAGKGTGLGLSRVYGFLQQSGGKVRASNMASGGAMLTMYFPRMVDKPTWSQSSLTPESSASVFPRS